MTPAPSRFTFDLDLGRREERGRMLTDQALADMLQAARMEGFAQGYAEAEQSLASVSSRRLADAADMLADKAAEMLAAVDQARNTAIDEAADLALSVGRKLAGALIAREPAAELEAMLAECLASLEGVPHLVIRCHPDVAETIRAAAEARAAITGFTGRLVVIGDPVLGLSDGRVEWADGGLVRNASDISARIDGALAEFVSARKGKLQSQEHTP